MLPFLLVAYLLQFRWGYKPSGNLIQLNVIKNETRLRENEIYQLRMKQKEKNRKMPSLTYW